jgi:hypothetical protein
MRHRTRNAHWLNLFVVSFIGPWLVIMLLGLETMGLAFSFGNPYSDSLENSIIPNQLD